MTKSSRLVGDVTLARVLALKSVNTTQSPISQYPVDVATTPIGGAENGVPMCCLLGLHVHLTVVDALQIAMLKTGYI